MGHAWVQGHNGFAASAWERHWRRVDWSLVPSTVVVPQRAARTEWRKARFVDPAACRRAGMRPELVEAFERGFDMGFDRQPG